MPAVTIQVMAVTPFSETRAHGCAGESNRPGIAVRPLTASDWDNWWRLRLRALADHPDAFAQDIEDAISAGEQTARERFETHRIGNSNRVFGAFTEDDTLVGVAGIDRSEPRKLRHRMEIGGVYVVPEARGAGTGERLIAACVDHARQVDGVRQVHIGVAAHNRAAARLYERCGFSWYARDPRLLLLPDGTAVDEDLMVLMLDT
jgi:RimJ/RimL family protein N-acetyltransferase